MNKYVFRKYEDVFPQLFEKEKIRLSKYLTGEYHIEHVGSTAVEGLGGKGIIDIYIVSPINNQENIKSSLIKAGYEARPGFSQSQHVSFRIDLLDPVQKLRRYHIHFGNMDSEDFKRVILLRDYLRNHPDDANKYAEIKKRAADQAGQDKDKYMDIKSPFIEEILKKTLL